MYDYSEKRESDFVEIFKSAYDNMVPLFIIEFTKPCVKLLEYVEMISCEFFYYVLESSISDNGMYTRLTFANECILGRSDMDVDEGIDYD